jgi:hypothetical protein
MVAERKLRIRGDESASYALPDDATADIIFIYSDGFSTGSETLDLVACPMFWGWSLNSAEGLHFSFDIQQSSVHATRKENDGRI